MTINDQQNKLYRAQSNQELREQYRTWAENYDQDLVDQGHYIAPQKVVEVLLRLLPKDAKILDAGAGTGLVGEVLSDHGYSTLEGMDISVEMLAEAGKKKVYTALYPAVMGEPLDLATDTFDGVVIVGVFTYGHAPSGALDELIRVTKPGGYIVFTLRLDFYRESDFAQKLTALEAGGQWSLVEVGDRFSPLVTAPPDGDYRIWVYQVN